MYGKEGQRYFNKESHEREIRSVSGAHNDVINAKKVSVVGLRDIVGGFIALQLSFPVDLIPGSERSLKNHYKKLF